MPCRTDDWVQTPGEKAITRNRELTNLLCAMCTTFLSGAGGPQYTAIKQEDGTSYNAEVWKWWADHLEDDRKASEKRAKAKALAKKKSEAMGKLTYEEQQLLGIRK